MPIAAPRPVESHRILPKLLRLAVAAVLAAGAVGVVTGCESEVEEVAIERGPLEPGSFAAQWKVEVNEARYGKVDRLYRRGDLVIAYTDTNTVIVIGAESGQTVFIDPTIARREDRLFPPLRIDALNRIGNQSEFLAFPRGDTFVLRTTDGEPIGMQSRTGEPISETVLTRNLTSAGFASDGVVYVGSADDFGGRLLQVDPTKAAAQVLARVQFPQGITARPVAFQNLVYAADLAGNVYGLDESLASAWRGRRGFRTEGGRGIEAGLAVDSFGVYAAGTDGTLYVLDRLRGTIKWKFLAGEKLFDTPVPTDDYVYQAIPTAGVAAIKKASGSFNSRQPAWVARDAEGYLSSDDRRVYLLQRDGSIAAHDIETGEILYETRRNDYVAFARNREDPRIFAASADGVIVAVEPINRRGEVGEYAAAPASDTTRG